MRVLVQLRRDIALELHRQYSHKGSTEMAIPEAVQLINAVTDLGVRLTPVHPGQTDPLLAPYFMVDTKDRGTAERIISHLARLNGVEAAYLRPEDEMP